MLHNDYRMCNKLIELTILEHYYIKYKTFSNDIKLYLTMLRNAFISISLKNRSLGIVYSNF